MNSVLETLAQQAVLKNLKIATAESCTGGWIAQEVTALAGSSDWFDCGFVTYSNNAKHTMLGVPSKLIETDGAVSEAVVRAMAEGAVANSEAGVSVSVSGIAGPGGGSPEKPVGTVWMAWHREGYGTEVHCFSFTGDREAVRRQAVDEALKGLVKQIAK